jgi:hypothetical protein
MSTVATVAPVAPYDITLGADAPPAPLATGMSPNAKARLAAALLLATVVGGIVAQGFLSDRMLIVTGDAAATARNIAASPNLLRVAYAIFMLEMACQVAHTAMMYDLLRPVDRSAARTMAVFGFLGAGFKTLARLFFYAPLFVLGGASYFSAFDARQLEALAYLLIRIQAQGTQIAMIFFGVSTLLTGYLVLRSTFLPRFMGIISLIGGAGWLTYVYPPLGNKLFMPLIVWALIGCAVTIGWLLIRGVDEQKWYAMVARSSSSIWR